ncbi:hypothetical protein RUND412_003245 [Rhizina undulata]
MGNINSHTNSDGNIVVAPDNELAAIQMAIGNNVGGTDGAVIPDIINKLGADPDNLKLPGSFPQAEKVSDSNIHVSESSNAFVIRARLFSYLKRNCFGLNNPGFTYPKDPDCKEEHLPQFIEIELLGGLTNFSLTAKLLLPLPEEDYKKRLYKMESYKKRLHEIKALPSYTPKQIILRHYRRKYMCFSKFLDWFFGTAEND